MAHLVDEYVGQRVRLRRRAIGMTQKQLGDAVGTKFQQIQKYETGYNRISASRLWDIAKILDVQIDFFFEGFQGVYLDETEQNDTNKKDLMVDPEAIDLVNSYYAMPELQRRKLFDLARVLSDAV